jgi:hypothetical protein
MEIQSLKSQETSESDGIYTDGSLFEGRVVAGGVFGYLRYKGILCTWLTCYGLPN